MAMANTLADRYGNLIAPYGTFSGTDIIATLLFPGSPPIVLGEVSTLSYSIYREKVPVRTLGRISAKGFTKGPRTVAGTIIFTVFDKHVVNTMRDQLDVLRQAGRLKSDELPPFDLLLSGGNEFGAAAAMRIYGVTVIEEGMTFSVEDIFSENIWQYEARDIRLLDNDISEGSWLTEPSRSAFRDGTDMALGFFQPADLDAAKAVAAYQDALRSMMQQRTAQT